MIKIINRNVIVSFIRSQVMYVQNLNTQFPEYFEILYVQNSRMVNAILTLSLAVESFHTDAWCILIYIRHIC